MQDVAQTVLERLGEGVPLVAPEQLLRGEEGWSHLTLRTLKPKARCQDVKLCLYLKTNKPKYLMCTVLKEIGEDQIERFTELYGRKFCGEQRFPNNQMNHYMVRDTIRHHIMEILVSLPLLLDQRMLCSI